MSASPTERLRSLLSPAGGTSSVRSLTGWGRTNPTVADVEAVAPDAMAQVVARSGERGVLVRGLGRSYGDAAQNGGGLVVTIDDEQSTPVVDAASGTMTVSAGRSLDAVLAHLVPRGWFVPVTPGTRFVTVGGAIASDIHGKNHHVDGSFGDHLLSIRLLTADGTVHDLTPDSDLFWATVGGMGLTGVILDATVRLLRIETSRMSVDTTRIPDLDTLFAAMSEGDETFRYSVAWIDLMAKGRQLGRSVLTRGDHATLDQLEGDAVASPLEYGPRQLVSIPPIVPPMGVLNRATVGAFTELWFRKSPRRRVGELQTIANYFHPLDLVGSWNRLYGAQGMVQYQFVVPFGAEPTMRAVIERLADSGITSFLAVLKRFGAANRAPLSFPFPGWTLALDVPSASSGLAELLHGLDRLVLDAGGRHYFAKDACTTPSAVQRGYPRLEEWKAVRRRVDPTGRWQSDLGRRLGLLD